MVYQEADRERVPGVLLSSRSRRTTEVAAKEWVGRLSDLAKERGLAAKAGPALMGDDDRTFVTVIVVG